MGFWKTLFRRSKGPVASAVDDPITRTPEEQEREKFLLSNGIVQNKGYGYMVTPDGYVLALWMAQDPERFRNKRAAIKRLVDAVERDYSLEFFRALPIIRQCLSKGVWTAHACAESIGGGYVITFPCISCDDDPMTLRLWRSRGIDYRGPVFILKPGKSNRQMG